MKSDYNTVLDNGLDIISGLPHEISELTRFTNLLLDVDLVDTWRAMNLHGANHLQPEDLIIYYIVKTVFL